VSEGRKGGGGEATSHVRREVLYAAFSFTIERRGPIPHGKKSGEFLNYLKRRKDEVNKPTIADSG